MSNHLISEKSPYLLQHAHNPVDWRPWGEAAFAKARAENKPILVSIGYSTCHWCHVMEKESFSNREIAALMNENLVCVKVDREERPDVDKIYMTAVTALTGSGGWPLNVFLTPELKPFYGGTYFPPDDRWGRISWPQLVERIGAAWKSEEGRARILESAEQLKGHLNEYLGASRAESPLEAAALDEALQSFEISFDSKLGGFGRAPKFPMPVNQNFLFRYFAWKRKSPEQSALGQSARDMALFTLRKMAEGGIYDHVGGGFHRYSTDEIWQVPHFEKMLYDNAQLAVNYLEAHQVGGDPFFAGVARETLEYMLRDLGHPDGGFYSAEDADSLPPELAGKVSDEGHENRHEGAFYLWTEAELREALDAEKAELVIFLSGARPEGNAVSDPLGEFKGKNVIALQRPLTEAAEKFGKGPEQIAELWNEAKSTLLDERAARPRPHRDDKILASWNGLAISAFAKASQVLDEPLYLKAAAHAAEFIRRNLYEPASRQLYRRWRDRERNIAGVSDDYAFLIQGVLDLYEASFDGQWLDWAIELSESMNRRFYDEENGGFFMTDAAQNGHLIVRTKEDNDGVEPAASSVACMNLLRLSQLAERPDFYSAAEKTLKSYALSMREAPRGYAQMLCALQYALSEPQHIVLIGPRDAQETKNFLRAIHRRFLPDRALLLIDSDDARQKLAAQQPFLKELRPVGGKPTAYVCVNYACELPTNDLKEMEQILDRVAPQETPV